MRLIVLGQTDTGRVRGHNEDQYLALVGEQSPPGPQHRAEGLVHVAAGPVGGRGGRPGLDFDC